MEHQISVNRRCMLTKLYTLVANGIYVLKNLQTVETKSPLLIFSEILLVPCGYTEMCLFGFYSHYCSGILKKFPF